MNPDGTFNDKRLARLQKRRNAHDRCPSLCHGNPMSGDNHYPGSGKGGSLCGVPQGRKV